MCPEGSEAEEGGKVTAGVVMGEEVEGVEATAVVMGKAETVAGKEAGKRKEEEGETEGWEGAVANVVASGG